MVAKIKPNVLSLCDALTLMERLDDESVDLVYLDPPLNTGKELDMQNDDYLEFIYRVLQQSFRVLSKHGNLFLFSNYEQGADFHMLVRKVFDRNNRKIDFVIPPKRFGRLQTSHTYGSLIVYGKSNKPLNTRVKKLTKKEINNIFPFNDHRGSYRQTSLFMPSRGRGVNVFEWSSIIPPAGNSWRYSLSKMKALADENLIEIRKSGVPVLKQYASEEATTVDVGAIWDDIHFYEERVYSAQQPSSLTERVLLVGSEVDQIILDPFCGSGTMPIACTQLDRRFIASDNNGEAFRLSMERIESFSQGRASLSLLEEDKVAELPIVWNKYQTVSPTEEDFIIEMLKSGEGERLEFKESLIWNHNRSSRHTSFDNVMKAVSAFMNTDGGTVILGVKDDASLLGLSRDFTEANSQKNNSDGFAIFFNQKAKDIIGVSSAAYYSLKFYEINECHICCVTVAPSNHPVFLNKELFVRNGNQSVKLNNEEFYNYLNVRFSK